MYWLNFTISIKVTNKVFIKHLYFSLPKEVLLEFNENKSRYHSCPDVYSYASCSKCEVVVWIQKGNNVFFFFFTFIIDKIILNESFFKYFVLCYSNFYSRHTLEKDQILFFRFCFWQKNIDWELVFLYCIPYYSRFYSITYFSRKYCCCFFASVFEEKILIENWFYYIVFLIIRVFILYMFSYFHSIHDI